MTSRLKHKLELENVNLKSAYLNESFVQIGTPLPALAETKKDKQEFKPLWEQEVTDEQGRRRFHGAFTGGFSAGYFNTVGSKEGWTPSTFKSSRNNRASKVQRAEDFMDEEDLAQMKEDRRLESTEEFRHDAFAGTREEMAGKSLTSALESMVIPAKTSIGQTLLQKLGWRPGQGVGPRVTLRKLKIQEGKLGRVRAGMEVDDDEGEASKHTFAPRDSKLLVYDAKDDKQGLGFEKGKGMGKLPGKRTMYGTLGDDDDDDPYGASGSADIDRRHYAFDEGEEDDVIVMGGNGSKPASRKAQAGSDSDRWHDGRPILVGFALDAKGVPPDKWFAFPEVPTDWRPRPARVWGTTRKFDDTPQAPEKELIRGAPGRPLTHDQRGEALGEKPTPAAPLESTAKSVFDYMSEKDRERLAAFAAAAKAGTAPPPPLSLEEVPELPPERATEIVIPPLSPRTASAALQGYMPYKDDDEKAERYRSYLVSQTYNTKHPNPQLLPSTSIDEVNKELAAFSESARIFKPMSFAMSSRFTSGSASLAASDLKQARPGLHIYDPEKGPQFTKPESTEIQVTKVLTPREQAAADGRHGILTRVVKNFYPVKLVCKRFHVADPHPEGAPEGTSGTSTPTAGGGAGLDAMPLPKNDAAFESRFVHQEGTDRTSTPPPPPPASAGERVPRSIAEVGMADDVNQGRDTLTYTKPSIDVFKAIFASDDEDDDDEEDEPVKTVATKATSATTQQPADPYPVDDKPVDYASFKPVFRRAGDASSDAKDKADKDKRKKDKKDKKKRKGVLSFDVGEEAEEGVVQPKKKLRPVAQDEWVEKAPPAAAAQPTAATTPPLSASSTPGAAATGISRRKGAGDFM